MPTEDGPKVPPLSQNGLVDIREHLGGEKPDAAFGDQTNSPAVADTRNKKTKRTTQKVDSFEKTADRIIEQVIDGIAGVTEAMAAKFLDQTTHTRANEPVVQAVPPASALAAKLNGIQPPKPTPEKKRTRGRTKIEVDKASYRMAILEAWKRAKEAGVSREKFCEKSIEYILSWGKAHPHFQCSQLTTALLENFQAWYDQQQRRDKARQT
jgi:hypothetical protein